MRNIDPDRVGADPDDAAAVLDPSGLGADPQHAQARRAEVLRVLAGVEADVVGAEQAELPQLRSEIF